jgi:hypothetical protein
MLAQGFKSKRDAIVRRVYLYLSRTGSPDGYMRIQIRADNSGPGNIIVDGFSSAIMAVDIETAGEWVAFDFDQDALPKLEQDTQYYISLFPSVEYTYSTANNVQWHGDQIAPYYLDGAGYIYSGSTWSAISTTTDFAFRVLTGTRLHAYPSVRAVESMSAPMTDAERGRRFTHTTVPTIEAVLSYEEHVSNMIDGWLAGAAIETPLTNEDQITLIQPYANYCAALECELTYRTSGFYSEEGDTRASALRKMCNELREDARSKGVITTALREEQNISTTSGYEALSAGHLEADERDENVGDSNIIQPVFRAGMWDNQ